MSHLDEGTLHALLDGELDLHEVKEIQAHIGSCAACGTRLREVKEFHGESDRLVGLLELPATPSRLTAPADPEPVQYGDSSVDRRRKPRNQSRISGQVNEPPPLLLPENSAYRSGGLIRRMRWAALLLVTVGAGYMVSQMGRPSNYAFEGELAPVRLGDSTPGAVLSSEEDASATAAGGAAGETLQVAAKSPAAPETKTAAPVPRRAAPRPASATPRPAEEVRAAAANEGRSDRKDTAAAIEESDLASADDPVDRERTEVAAAEAADETVPATEQRNVREEAAVALRELDRERQMERAAAATAALDSARRRDALTRQAAAPAPAPRTPSSAPASISASVSTKAPSSWDGRYTSSRA